jgi:hypothetical protein
MEIPIILLILAALAGGMIWYYNRKSHTLDINNDGRIDVQDAAQAINATVQGAKQDVRNARDAALVIAAESAMKAAGVIEQTAKTAKRAAKTTVAKTAATKKPTRKPRARKKPTLA